MKIVKRQMMLHHAVSMIGGFMGGYTILNFSDIFPNAQTGNLIRLVLNVTQGDFSAIGFMVLLFVIYAAGNVFYAVVRRHIRISMKIVSFIVTSVMIALVGLLATMGTLAAVMPVAFAMPVQWNAFKIAGGNSSATTFSSNNVRQAVMQLTVWFMDKDKKALRVSRFYWATLLCFHIGVAASGLFSLFFGAQSIWFCYIFVGLAVAAYYRYESEKIRAFSGTDK